MKMSEASYFKESLALLKILALGQKDMEEGKAKLFRTAFADIRARIGKERSLFHGTHFDYAAQSELLAKCLSCPSASVGHPWFQIKSGYKSFQVGLLFSIKLIFQDLFHFFNCFSRIIALSIDSVASKYTRLWIVYFLVKPSMRSFLCS